MLCHIAGPAVLFLLATSAHAVPHHTNVTAGNERVCKWYGIGKGEYCCPHAKHCLRPVKGKTCGNETACATGETCCPLTKLCVTVHAPCTPSPHCPATAYCCPDAKRCMTPTNPGVLCRSRSECASDEICCPTARECVKVGGECQEPIEDKSASAGVQEPSLAEPRDNHSIVYIIRHGEKTWSGGCLNPPGQERANILKELIFNGKSSSKHATFKVPTKIFADQYFDGTDCERCWLTVEPISQALQLPTEFDHGHKMNGGNAAAAAAIRNASLTEPVILVAWEHVNIQYLTADLGVNKAAIPHWKGTDYDTVYELTLDSQAKLVGFDVKAQNYQPCSTSSKYSPCKH